MDAAGTASAQPLGILQRRAVRLEWFSVAWMVAEAGIAATFFTLACYVIIGAAVSLATHAHSERSPAGIGLTISSLAVMPMLGWRKHRVGAALRNQLVLADAAETILCATLAATTLLGLVLFAAFGWWWADPISRVGGRRVIAGRNRSRFSDSESTAWPH